MSRCELKIEFYRPERVFRTGGPVQGWVSVRVDRNIPCRGLSLLARWVVHGRGNPSQRNYHTETLFQGQWLAGEQYEYSFEFQPPCQPLSWHGCHVNVDHVVSVRADIPWTVENRCEEKFFWLPGTQPTASSPASPSSHSPHSAASDAGGLANQIRTGIAALRLGSVDWRTPDSAVPGELLKTQLSIGPGRRADLRGIELTLSAFEVAIRGSGKTRKTARHKLFCQRYPVPHEKFARPGGADPVAGYSLEFPQTDAWSLDLPDNQVAWWLTLRIRTAWWPDWIQSRRIVVSPFVSLGVN